MYSQVLESWLFSLWPVLLLYLPVEGSTSATAQPGTCVLVLLQQGRPSLRVKGADAGRAAPASPGLAGVRSGVREVPCSSEVLHAPRTKVSQGRCPMLLERTPLQCLFCFLTP